MMKAEKVKRGMVVKFRENYYKVGAVNGEKVVLLIGAWIQTVDAIDLRPLTAREKGA